MTQFSPFKLIYFRHVRGLLDLLKEECIPKEDTSEDVATYVTITHENEKCTTDGTRTSETENVVQM